jgi:hypothetical protein
MSNNTLFFWNEIDLAGRSYVTYITSPLANLNAFTTLLAGALMFDQLPIDLIIIALIHVPPLEDIMYAP